jgi:hypothetical protein
MQQYFDGRYTDYHDDSHLHFEMRYFYDASNIYVNYPNCNGYLPGRGYTYPQHPDDFPPSQSEHYTDPIAFVQSREGVFLPLIIRQEPTCSEASSLIVNRDFEQGHAFWVELGSTIIYNSGLPVTPHGGSWAAWLGGYNNATDTLYQSFLLPNGATSVNLAYYAWMDTQETTTGTYDYLRVRLRNGSGTLLQTIDTLNDNLTKRTWLIRTFTVSNLGQYAGQTLRLSFEGTTDGSYFTSFVVDDISFVMHCSRASGSTGGVVETEMPIQDSGSKETISNPEAIQPKPTTTPQPYP